MKEKSTDNLREELMGDNALDSYLQEHAGQVLDSDTSRLLAQLYAQKHITKAELARRASISEVYLHQVFSGRRRPSRDRLLCICIGLGASPEETQNLLKRAGHAQLYVRFRRDAIILYGLIHQFTLGEINDKLFSENEKTLA